MQSTSIMSFPPSKRCCEPLNCHPGSRKRRLVSFALIAEHPSLGLTQSNYLCPDCRKELKTKHLYCSKTMVRGRTPTPSSGYCADNIKDSAGDDESSTYSPESEKTSDCTSEEESNSAGPSSAMPKRKARSHGDAGGRFTPLPFSAVGGYVSVAYDGYCWLGCMLNVNEQEQTPSSTLASHFSTLREMMFWTLILLTY